jgi:hypothetical protein
MYSDLTEEIRPVFTMATTIIPISPAMQAWLVWDHGDIVGPWPVVAVAQETRQMTVCGHIETHPGYANKKTIVTMATEPDIGNDPVTAHLDWFPPKYLILAPSAGEWETPWVAAKHVFFGEDAAREAAVTYKANYDIAHAAKANA